MNTRMQMDQTTIAKLTRLRILRSKQGLPFNLREFVTDKDMARVILHECLSSQDEETISIALNLTRSLGMLGEASKLQDNIVLS